MNYKIKVVKEILKLVNERNYIEEKEILRIKNFYQDALFKKDFEFIEFINNFRFFNKIIRISPEQNEKGKEYLKKKYLTMFGYQRTGKLIKLDYVSRQIIERANWKEVKFYFAGFVIISNGILKFIEPIYLFETYERQTNFYKAFRYFHYGDCDYNFNFNKDEYLKGDSILFIKDFI